MWSKRIVFGVGCAAFISYFIFTSTVTADTTGPSKGSTVVLDTSDLVGTWVNVNPDTRGLTRLIIKPDKDTLLQVRAFASCSPDDCSWGKETAIAYGEDIDATSATGFSATFDGSPSNDLVLGWLRNGTLRVRVFSKFTDNSDRANNISFEKFQREL